MAYKQIRRRMKRELSENDGAAPEVHHAPDLSQIQTDRDLMTTDDAMALQDLVGNRATGQIMGVTPLSSPLNQGGKRGVGYVQPKATPAPILRRESSPDRPAYAHIMRKLTPLSSPLIQGGERGVAGGDGSFETNDNFESKVNQQSGGGKPLPSDVRADLEPKFGADFSGVRVHADGQAAQLSQDVGAQAFTHGNDIYFNEGKYNPESGSGQHLLAHELTHTVQQGAAGQLHRQVMSADQLKEVAGNPGSKKSPYGKLIEALKKYTEREKGTLARGEQTEKLLKLKELAQAAFAKAETAQRAKGLTDFIADIEADLDRLSQGMTGQNWQQDLLDPTQKDDWQVTADTWSEKSSLGEQFSSDATLWYATLFGGPGVEPTVTEQAQQAILKRMFLTMASAGVESRAGADSSKTPLTPLPGAAPGNAPGEWGAFPFPLAAAMSHGRRAQLQFGAGSQGHAHEGWEWLTTGEGGNQSKVGQRGVEKFSDGNRILNSEAEMYARTSTHSADEQGEIKYSGGGLVKGGLSGDILNQTAGMDVAFGGRGNALPQNNTVAQAGATVGEKGSFPVNPNARDLKGKLMGDKGGQHGHMLMRPKNSKTDAGKVSNILISMEDTKEHKSGLSGHFHDASAAPESTTVTGQTQWTHMQDVGLTQGLSAEELARLPRGYDALRAQVKTAAQFQSIQAVSEKILALDNGLQKILFRHLLIANAGQAKQIMTDLIQRITQAGDDWEAAVAQYLGHLGMPAVNMGGGAPHNPIAHNAVQQVVGPPPPRPVGPPNVNMMGDLAQNPIFGERQIANKFSAEDLDKFKKQRGGGRPRK